MQHLPILIIVALLFVVMSVSRRNRQRAATRQLEERQKIGFGSEVMTTSGLYGTVIRVDEDDTVQLAIAPGVEVKWALAAIRDVPAPPELASDASGHDDPGESNGPNEPPAS